MTQAVRLWVAKVRYRSRAEWNCSPLEANLEGPACSKAHCPSRSFPYPLSRTMPRIEYRLEEARCESAGTIRLLKPLVGLIFAQCFNSIVSAVYFTAHHLAVSAEPVTKRYPQ